jgi:hypothetical protein
MSKNPFLLLNTSKNLGLYSILYHWFEHMVNSIVGTTTMCCIKIKLLWTTQ